MSSIKLMLFLAALTANTGNFETKPVGILMSRASLDRNQVVFETLLDSAGVTHSESFSPDASPTGKGEGWLIFNLTQRNGAALESTVFSHQSPNSGRYRYTWPSAGFVSQLRQLQIRVPELNARVLSENGELANDMEVVTYKTEDSEEQRKSLMAKSYYVLEAEKAPPTVKAADGSAPPPPPPTFSPQQSLMVEFGELNDIKKRWETLHHPEKSSELALEYYRRHFQSQLVEVSLAVTNPQLGAEESPLPDTVKLNLSKHAKAGGAGGYLTSPSRNAGARTATSDAAPSPFPLRMSELTFGDPLVITVDAQPLIDYVIRPLLAPEGKLDAAPPLECVINPELGENPSKSACRVQKLADNTTKTIITGNFTRGSSGNFNPIVFSVRDPNYKREEYRVRIKLLTDAKPPKASVTFTNAKTQSERSVK